MAWERRSGKLYFYTRPRVNGRRIHRYVGKGPAAELAAAVDEMSRRQRRIFIEQRRLEQQRWDEADSPLRELIRTSDILLRAALGLAGYFQHRRGEWRSMGKKRGTIMIEPRSSCDLPTEQFDHMQEVLRRATQGDRTVVPELRRTRENNSPGGNSYNSNLRK